ncbi:cytochrome c oxidase subunit II [Halioxenophilus sp. WMMB6]|uniref:cytochrome c oxidase subunit II n=1 Tax=Halioxenophilus sp. WMMB6 TaxID=3073815 RepID=UPI00295EB657|nr:cytochrome c oxidase subunit II [Halioxenophilus sp. WMMB6]
MLTLFRKYCSSLFAVLLCFGVSAVYADIGDRWHTNMTEGVTPVSRQIYSLHMDIFWWCVAIGVVVFGVMFYTMIAHRKSRGAEAANFHESTALEILWTIIPFVILIIMAVPATSTLIKIYDTKEADLDIVITGYQWKWKYEYLNKDVSYFSNLSTPDDEIHNLAEKNPNYLLEVDEPLVIPTNKKVRFLITANDVIHAWWVPALAVKKDAIPGFINETWTYVEEPGIYRGQCAELCGKNHGFMPIVVEAKPEAEYLAWLEDKQATAAKLRELTEKTFTFEELMTMGEEVYQTTCAPCHQANGQGVPGAFPAIAGSAVATGDIAQHMNMVVFGSRKNPAMQAFGEQLSEVKIASVITYQRNSFGNNMGDSLQPIDILNFKESK